MPLLKCQCCGHEERLTTESAFEAGWDAPPHFSHVCCPLCPAVCVVMGRGHKRAHALWAKEGRPDDFSMEKCTTDEHFGDAPKIAAIKQVMGDIERVVRKATK